MNKEQLEKDLMELLTKYDVHLEIEQRIVFIKNKSITQGDIKEHQKE